MVESIKKLREICQKPISHSNTWYQRKFSRKISIYLTWFFIHLKISGNTTSILVLITGIIAPLFFILGNYLYYVVGVLLLQLWYLLDHVDGELARYWKKTSAKGIFIDKINHHIVHPLIFLCMGIGLYKEFNNYLMLILGGFTAYFLLLQDLINIDKKDAVSIFNMGIKKVVNQKFGLKNLLCTKISAIIYKVPGMMNILTIAAFFNLFHYAFLFYAFTYPIMILIKLVHNLNIPYNKFK